VFPQKPLQFLRIQAHRDVGEVHEDETTPAFIKDVDARVLFEGQPPACFAHDQQKPRLPVRGSKLILQPAQAPVNRFHLVSLGPTGGGLSPPMYSLLTTDLSTGEMNSITNSGRRLRFGHPKSMF
jgi:hypothetical protein